ncbi:hypothetical protein OH77DRAFT_1522024 [Trametes cingulata]|nr:hypothetical protein OH77DRAFT_1522024 [Trametes cingulata]
MNVSAGPGAAAHRAPPLDPDRMLKTMRNEAYPRQLWWLIAGFVFLVATCQFLSCVVSKCAWRTSETKQDVDSEARTNISRRRFSWRRLPLAIVNTYRVIAFRCTLDIGQSYTLNFAEVFVTCAYIAAIFTWEFVNTTTVDGHKLDVSYWGGRAGALGASQFPLITALGTKHNVLAYITGISYDKLNYVHRMAARVVFVLLWVHGGSKIAHFLPAAYDEPFVRMGLTAMVAFSVLVLVSLRPVRAQAYELFYFTHFATVLIMLVGAYVHTSAVHSASYIWPCFLIWGLDRLLRLLRVLYHNHLYFTAPFSLSPSPSPSPSRNSPPRARELDATAELLSPHLIRLHLQRPAHVRWTPGQTAFLTVPGVSRFPLEAHPFTIASVDSRYALISSSRDSSYSSSSSSEKSGEKSSSHVAVEAARLGLSVEDEGEKEGEGKTPWNDLVFLINVRGGFTRRLACAASRGDKAQAQGKVKAFVDGPYGFSPALDGDDVVLLVAGGSGVSFTLATFLGVLSDVEKGRSRCRRVVFVWTIREASHIEWISHTLSKALELAPAEVDISIRIFITSTSPTSASGNGPTLKHARSWNEDDSVHSSSNDTAVGKTTTFSSLLSFPAVRVSQGRPDLGALLREEVEVNTGRMSVTVCGPQGIARACRAALRLPMSTTLKGGPSVVLHVESFGYA